MASDPYKYFRLEARELVEHLGKGMLELERTGNAELVGRLLRQAHTLKGAARVVRQGEIADRAHAIEDTLAPLRDAGARPTSDLIGRVLAIVDEISRAVATLEAPTETRPAAPAAPEPAPIVRAELAEMDALLDGLIETTARVGTLRSTVDELETAGQLADALVAQLASRDVRDAGKRRELAESLRELVRRCERELRGGVEHTTRELSQVRDTAEQLRLVPAATLLASLERTARDAAQTLGKQIAFEGRGGDVRLDAHVLSAIQGALVQLVRNAVAHGVESLADRVARRKPPAGRIVVEIERRGGRVRFTCRDDGRGLDLEAVRLAARARGIARAETLGASEIVSLLLRGGITTTARVTEVAGRGVGLDVVRAVCEKLGGEVRVDTASGVGATFDVIVPISLTSIEALIVEAGGVHAALPLDAVRATRRVRAGEVVRTSRGETIVHDGNMIPVLRLAPVLLGDAAASRARDAWAIVVVGANNGVAGLAADHLGGTSTIVVRPIPEVAAAEPFIAGAALDVSGNPRLVLDPAELVAAASRDRAFDPPPEPTRHAILVIDDSLTTRMLEQSILESAGYDVDTAVSGEHALEAARKRRYALFLVDVEMPGIDGFTFIERVRSDPELRDTPAILVTSRADADDRLRGERVGAQGYIVKSEFDQGDLLARIERMVG
jgi:two-component system, chemotaxis family, sensor kinase CheA